MFRAAYGWVELADFDDDTKRFDFKNQFRWNEAYYHLAGGF